MNNSTHSKLKPFSLKPKPETDGCDNCGKKISWLELFPLQVKVCRACLTEYAHIGALLDAAADRRGCEKFLEKFGNTSPKFGPPGLPNDFF